jgi:hypothetical protein
MTTMDAGPCLVCHGFLPQERDCDRDVAPEDVALCLVSPDNASAQDRAVPPVRAGIVKSVTGKQIHSPTGTFYNRVRYL